MPTCTMHATGKVYVVEEYVFGSGIDFTHNWTSMVYSKPIVASIGSRPIFTAKIEDIIASLVTDVIIVATYNTPG